MQVRKTRIRRKRNLIKAINFKPNETNRLELDRHIFDVVMKCLYHNADRSELAFEADILKHAKIKLPPKEVSRLWNVLASSNWVSPTVGFGRAGKLELTHAGYQLMSQYYYAFFGRRGFPWCSGHKSGGQIERIHLKCEQEVYFLYFCVCVFYCFQL